MRLSTKVITKLRPTCFNFRWCQCLIWREFPMEICHGLREYRLFHASKVLL